MAASQTSNPLALAVFAGGCGLLAWVTRTRREVAPLLVPLILGLAIAVLSGTLGSTAWLRVLLANRGLSPEEIQPIVHTLRKSVHFALYAAIAGTSYGALRRIGWFRRCVVLALVWTMSHALLDEARQSLTVGRTGRLSDLAIDLGGALAGIALAWAFLRSRTRRSPLP